MINARESLDLLLSSDKLEGLLAAARTKAASLEKKSNRSNIGKVASDLERQVAEARELGSRAVRDLKDVLESKAAQRAEKVAIVRHLLHFGSKLVAA